MQMDQFEHNGYRQQCILSKIGDFRMSKTEFLTEKFKKIHH